MLVWCLLWSSPNLCNLTDCCSGAEFMMQIAISGTEFCGAAGRATKLIGSNKLRVATVIAIGDLILFLGKLCVSFASAFFASLMLDTHRYKTSQHRVSSPLFPVLVSFFYGYQSNEPRNMNSFQKKDLCIRYVYGFGTCRLLKSFCEFMHSDDL